MRMKWFSCMVAYVVKEWQVETSYRLNSILRIVGVLSELAMFFFIDRLLHSPLDNALAPYGVNYFAYVVVGLICFSYAGIGDLSRRFAQEQSQGTLELLMAVPVPELVLMTGMVLWNTLWASIDVLLYLLGAVFLYGLSFPHVNLLSVGIVGLLTVVAMNAVALLDAALLLVFKRGQVFSWVLGVSWGVLGGVYFPIDVLPTWLQRIAFFLPTTRAVQLMQSAFHLGTPVSELWPRLAPLLFGTVFFLMVGSYALQQALRFAKIQGSLSYG